MKYNRSRQDKYIVEHDHKIEVTKKHLVLRIVLFAFFLLLGATLIGIGISSINKKNSGMTEIKSTDHGLNVSSDFHFYYELGTKDLSPTVENKNITTLYSSLTSSAYDLFNHLSITNTHNLYYINHHPNEEIIIPIELYNALLKMSNLKERYLYLAPIFNDYQSLVNAKDDASANLFNPKTNAFQQTFVDDILSFVDDEKIKLEFLGNSKIKLNISSDYLDYMQNLERMDFINLNIFMNAFIIDYLVDNLIVAGYEMGYIYSNDGYFRNLCAKEFVKYHLFDFDQNLKKAFVIGKITIDQKYAIVSFLAFPAFSGNDGYYVYDDNTLISTILDNNGLCNYNYLNFTCLKENSSCAELALSIIDYYTTNTLNLDNNELKDVIVIYLKNRCLYYNNDQILIDELFENNNYQYRKELIE